MNAKPLLSLTVGLLLCPAAFAQQPGEKPLSESDLLKQIEALSPPSRTPSPGAGDRPSPKVKPESLPQPLFDGNTPDITKMSGGNKRPTPGGTMAVAPGTMIGASNSPDKTADKKAKGPTEITALEATFDQKANLAVFIGEVVVKDPEFNVICDKLTAHLKHDDKPKAVPGAPATPKPATPAATPAGKPGDASTAPKKGGGLEKAVAETTSDRRVIITQDKLDADGTIQHSIGKADRATYDAVTGDIVLYGSPDVIQGTNRVQATEASTVMTLNRDGHMKAVGPHKTTIVDKGDSAR